MTFLQLGLLLSRSRRMKAYKRARAEAQAISDTDLADMGLKRYQLGHVARAKALKAL
jgi:uncharacterized protein YjiS (DUF1127 family)